MRRFTVTQLTDELHQLLSARYPVIEVEGELSQVATPVSGHAYLTFRDQKSVLGGVVWKNTWRSLDWRPRVGDRVVARGRIGVFGGKGAYQLYVNAISKAGKGQLAAEIAKRKARLAAEGLLDPRRKRALPPFPKFVGVATSLTGAALQDFLKVSRERFPAAIILVAGCTVQGHTAPPSVVQALDLLLHDGRSEVLIVTRGGGSKEDLLAFQDEGLARFIAHSPVPTISAVGHQVDTTLSDLVADAVAPTPTAAAVLALPDGPQLSQQVDESVMQLMATMRRRLERHRQRVADLQRRLRHPGERLSEIRRRCDSLTLRLQRAMTRQVQREQGRLEELSGRLVRTPTPLLENREARRDLLQRRLIAAMEITLRGQRARVERQTTALRALSPQSVLDRGYAVVTGVKGVVDEASSVSEGDELVVRLARGRLDVAVLRRHQGDTELS